MLLDTVLEFEEPSYSIKLSYGRKDKVFRFKVLKTSHKATEINNGELEFEKQPKSDKNLSRKIYSFDGNYSLEYVPGALFELIIINNILRQLNLIVHASV